MSERDDGPMITVRRIRSDDVELYRTTRLAALLDTPSAFGRTHAEEVVYSQEEWKFRTNRGAAGEQSATFFAEVDSETAGLVGGYRPEPGLVELVSMWVAPAGRRRGTGKALVDAVIAWAGDDRLELWVTRGNDPAIALYERCGFVTTDEVQPLPSDPCKDEIRMRR